MRTRHDPRPRDRKRTRHSPGANGMRKLLHTGATLALAAGLVAAPAQAQDIALQAEPGTIDAPRGDLFIQNLDAVWTATGQVLQNASIAIEGGVIRAVGSDAKPPRGATVIDGSGMTAIPGLVDEHSHIAMEGTNEFTQPVVPEVRVIDALNARDFGIFRALSGGVTTAQILHGSSNQIGGQSAIIKTRWGYRASDFPGHLTGVSWWGPEDRRSGDGELNVVG